MRFKLPCLLAVALVLGATAARAQDLGQTTPVPPTAPPPSYTLPGTAVDLQLSPPPSTVPDHPVITPSLDSGIPGLKLSLPLDIFGEPLE